MYPMLVHAHSGLRWLVLLFLLAAIVNSFTRNQQGEPYSDRDRRLSLFALIFTHLQLVIGLVLYFISPKVQFSGAAMSETITRFYTVEHFTLMLLAVILITIGYSRTKRSVQASDKFKNTVRFYLIGLILILIAIPWPFRNLGAGLF